MAEVSNLKINERLKVKRTSLGVTEIDNEN